MMTEHPLEPLRKIIGYNIFELPNGHWDKYLPLAEVIHTGPADWERQLACIRDFGDRRENDAPICLVRLKQVSLNIGNVFVELLETVRHTNCR